MMDFFGSMQPTGWGEDDDMAQRLRRLDMLSNLFRAGRGSSALGMGASSKLEGLLRAWNARAGQDVSRQTAVNKVALPQTSTGVANLPAQPVAQQEGEVTLEAIAAIAQAVGLGDEGARVAQAIAQTEGGMKGATGDLAGGGSYGPMQLYWQGQLANLARDLGVSLAEAAQWVRTNPLQSVEWALKNYLGQTIQRGMEQGLTGSDLATYAQQYGQVSIKPWMAGENYRRLFGG